MPLLSCFTPCGHLKMSGERAHGQKIYETLRDTLLGPGYSQNPTSNVQARLYATAMACAAALYTLERARNQTDPYKCVELLAAQEKDHRIVPVPGSTIRERQTVLAARMAASRGARREAVEAVLASVLGAALVEYRTRDASLVDVLPAPGDEADVGNFVAPTTPAKILRVLHPGVTVGGSSLVRYEMVSGEEIANGDYLCVDLDPSQTRTERWHVSALNTSTKRFLTPSVYAHSAGVLATTGATPVWWSSQRYNLVETDADAAADAVVRAQIDEALARQLRVVSTWGITDGSEFTALSGRIGISVIGPP